MPGILKVQLLSYFHQEDFQGKRLLDFGCGFGSSTLFLAKLLPKTDIVGVELRTDRVEIAREIAERQGIKNAIFLCSPSGEQLPTDIGTFDFVMLSAVYEHLLPKERKVVMPLLWSVMKKGAAIFINQTPHRYFPYEHHSTGLWFINYLPDRLAKFMANKFASYNPSHRDPAINQSLNWADHLRGGIRGGTEWAIVRDLTGGNPASARILQPLIGDRADYWLTKTGRGRRFQKKLVAQFFRITDKLFGTVPSMNVDVVVSKE